MPASKKTKPLTAEDVVAIVNNVFAENARKINESAATLAPAQGVSPTTAADIRGMQLDDYLALQRRDITVEDAKVRAQFGANILCSINTETRAETDLLV